MNWRFMYHISIISWHILYRDKHYVWASVYYSSWYCIAVISGYTEILFYWYSTNPLRYLHNWPESQGVYQPKCPFEFFKFIIMMHWLSLMEARWLFFISKLSDLTYRLYSLCVLNTFTNINSEKCVTYIWYCMFTHLCTL